MKMKGGSPHWCHLICSIRWLLSFPPSQDESSPLPQPQTVVLNHLYIEKGNTRSVVALGITHRFKAKFVTVVLYKPVLRR